MNTERDRQQHQPLQIHFGAVLWSAAGLAALLASAMLISFAIMSWLDAPNTPSVRSATPQQIWQRPIAGAHVVPNQAYQTQQQHRRWRHQLSQYGWVDRPQQVVSIPIERAIQLAAARQMQWEWPGGDSAARQAPPASAAERPADEDAE